MEWRHAWRSTCAMEVRCAVPLRIVLCGIMTCRRSSPHACNSLALMYLHNHARSEVEPHISQHFRHWHACTAYSMTTFARSPSLSPAHMLLKQDHAAGLWESTDSLLCLLLCRWSQMLHLYLHLPVRGQQLVVMAACYLPTLLPRHCHGCSHDHQYAQACSCVIHLDHIVTFICGVLHPAAHISRSAPHTCFQSHLQPHLQPSDALATPSDEPLAVALWTAANSACCMPCRPPLPSPSCNHGAHLTPAGGQQSAVDGSICLYGSLWRWSSTVLDGSIRMEASA